MRRPLVAGNWKLHGTLDEVGRRVDDIVSGIAGIDDVDVAVCPVFVHIAHAVRHAAGSSLAVGAQDVSDEARGAFTGEVAAPMLAEAGCRYVIVGHSERRARHGETDAVVSAKCRAARSAGLHPIVCVGESLEQRDEGATIDVVRSQLGTVLADVGVEGFADAVVAYEPIWAIGTGRTATPAQAQEVHAALRRVLAEHDEGVAGRTRILYGGSVKGSNASELFAMADIDGGLVGGASLAADEFITICGAAQAGAAAE